MTATPTPIGAALREARGKRSMRWLADEIDLDYTHICRLERGERPASPEVIQKIARALQVDAGPLLELAPALPTEVHAELADPELRLALGPAALPDGTRGVLRRRHLAELAARVQARSIGRPRVPVDPSTLATILGARVIEGAADDPQIVVNTISRAVTVLGQQSSRAADPLPPGGGRPDLRGPPAARTVARHRPS